METTKCHVSSRIKHGTIRRHKYGGGEKNDTQHTKLHVIFRTISRTNTSRQGNEMKSYPGELLGGAVLPPHLTSLNFWFPHELLR